MTAWTDLKLLPRISPMSLSRALSKSIGRLLIGVVLFAQLAVASYACPGLKGIGVMEIGGTSAAALPAGCEQMDPDATNLCAEHCHQGQQSADTASALMVGVGASTWLYSLPLEPQPSLGSGWSFPAAGLHAVPEPPHAILHCVFRI